MTSLRWLYGLLDLDTLDTLRDLVLFLRIDFDFFSEDFSSGKYERLSSEYGEYIS